MSKSKSFGYGDAAANKGGNDTLSRHRKASSLKTPHRTSPIRGRGPKELQGSLLKPKIGSGPEAARPADWTGSAEEWIVYWALNRLGLHGNLDGGEDFQYQAARLGGRRELGGAVADFLVFPDLIINVQGVYWHYGRGSDKIASDRVQAIALASRGYRFVAIDSDQLDSDASGRAAIDLVSDALRGIDHSRFKNGMP